MPFPKNMVRGGQRTKRGSVRLIPMTASDVKAVYDAVDQARMIFNAAGQQMRQGFGHQWTAKMKRMDSFMVQYQSQICDAYLAKYGQTLNLDSTGRLNTISRNANGQRTIF